jgi:hypothetical protein
VDCAEQDLGQRQVFYLVERDGVAAVEARADPDQVVVEPDLDPRDTELLVEGEQKKRR